MEYFIAVLIIFGLLVFLGIAKKSIEKAKNKEFLTDDFVVVSKEFYESACKVSDLANNSPSIEYKRNHLPRALYNLEKEVLGTRREIASEKLNAAQQI